jgi:ATP-dependent Clp protease adapter protein ClpS
MSTATPQIEIEEEQDVGVGVQEPARVILFNDELHTFDEVIAQLIKAIGCAFMRAEALAWEVHNNGKAVVYQGDVAKCVQVSHVLEEIALMTQIEV